MRKGKRFTPSLVRSFATKGRGIGLQDEYEPWHKVGRADPASRGLSHARLLPAINRLVHLLSALEFIGFCFACMLLEQMVDLREQYPLALSEHQMEIAKYDVQYHRYSAPGTEQIAHELGLKHPVLKRHGDAELWRLTTDLVLTLRDDAGCAYLLAISMKYDEALKQRRTLELLDLERAYWERQGATFLVITPATYDRYVAANLLRSVPWVINEVAVNQGMLDACASFSRQLSGMSITRVLRLIEYELSVEHVIAQNVFWRCVWWGYIPIDLTRLIWPSSPISLIDRERFIRQNPIAGRRTSI